MNLSLVEPSFLAKELPEILQEDSSGRKYLRSGHSLCIRFSHRGDLLASGCSDGRVVIFDCDTSSVALKLQGHLRQVQSLSWSADDRYLLSASLDCRVVLWDLQTGECVRMVRFETPIFIAELHPSNHLLFVAALYEDQPLLVDITNDDPIKRTMTSAPKRSQEEVATATDKQIAQDLKQTTTVVNFSAAGDHIFCGTNKGWLNVVDTATCETLASSRVSKAVVLVIKFSRDGRTMTTYSTDRIIRTFTVPEIASRSFDFDTFHLEVNRQHQDVVGKVAYLHVCLHPNGEYVIASPQGQHSIYIWEEQQGSLIKILEAEEEITVLDFHPHKPCLAAVGAEHGRIYIFSVSIRQSWAALAPDFVEVEENVEYVEAEDEFDIQPPEELTKRRLDLEDEEVDVLTMDPVKDYQFRPGGFLLPVIMNNDASDGEEEFIATGAGQWRRKTPVRDYAAGEDGAGSDGESSKAASIANGNGKTAGGTKRKSRAA